MNKSTIIEILAICCVSTIATTLANKSQADGEFSKYLF